MFGIPIYSDNYIDHDYVVQAQGGFSEAVAGIANPKRNGVRIEIRCVIHRDTWSRLSNLATFITRNLTYVDHVAFMGYEAMGFGKTNARHLFVLPRGLPCRACRGRLHPGNCANSYFCLQFAVLPSRRDTSFLLFRAFRLEERDTPRLRPLR